MIQVVISDDALDDLNVGFWFYETQQAGMGDYFADKLRNEIESLKQTGGSHRVAHENFHRAISRIFSVRDLLHVRRQRSHRVGGR